MPGTFAVLFADPSVNQEPDQVPAIADALQSATGMLPYDATRHARDAMGIVLEELDYGPASDVAAALTTAGFPAGVADTGLLPLIEKPERVRQVVVGTEGLEVMVGYTGTELIPWGAIQLVGVCRHIMTETRFKAKQQRKKGGGFGALAAGMVGGPVGLAAYRVRQKLKHAGRVNMQKTVTEGECFVADIHTLEPARLLRIRSDDGQFPDLGERRRERAEWNFQTVISDAAERGDLLLSPPAQRFVRGDPLVDEPIDNLHHFEQYNRWLFLAAAAFAEQLDDDATPDTPQEGPDDTPPPRRSVQDDFAF
ncbi:MAG: hypothetical protein ACOCX4_02270 [Planctomycetota bacterium]